MDEFEVTRPMAREALQILHQKGLINLQPRIGATVQALGDWDLLDEDVIAWRLDKAPDSQMRSLTELREMIEPRAARLAATWRPAEICHDLISLAHRLHELSLKPDFDDPEAGRDTRQEFGDVDALFHRTLLLGSRNELLLRLAHPVKLALDHRIKRDWAGADLEPAVLPAIDEALIDTIKRYPRRPDQIAMWLHIGLAHAVDQGLPLAAEAFAEAILAEIRHGRLEDRRIRDQLREGLRQLNVNAMCEEDHGPFRRAMHGFVRERRVPVVVIGVKGSGKTTIGKLLAASLSAPYDESESLETDPDDHDRCRRLAIVARRVAGTDPDEGLVVAYPALRRIDREVLRAAHPRTFFVHLQVDLDGALGRVANRNEHSVVTTQFASLQPLDDDEVGLPVDATGQPLDIVSNIQAHLARLSTGL